MAGRIAIYELYPLMMSEIYTQPHEKLFPPLIERILLSDKIDLILNQEPDILLPTEAAAKKESQDYLLQWGGMPALLRVAESERNKWIKDYEYTYLERDLADLSRLNDLQPFRKFQKLSALRTGKLLNYSELARDSGISVDTARRYLEYLKLSYQIILLQPYYRNLTSALVKTPKLYWLDMGIVRNLAGIPIHTTSGELYETMVVSELFKYIKTQQMDVDLYFYRTHSGSEVDLLLQLRSGVIGLEIKSHTNIIKKDLRSLKEISSKLKDEWLGGIVIYNGNAIKRIAEPNIWAIPSWRLFT